MHSIHHLSFEGSGAVEFARLMKAIREETGFDIRLLQVEGWFAANRADILTLTVRAEEFLGTAEELREKISTYKPLKKDDKKGKKEQSHE